MIDFVLTTPRLRSELHVSVGRGGHSTVVVGQIFKKPIIFKVLLTHKRYG